MEGLRSLLVVRSIARLLGFKVVTLPTRVGNLRLRLADSDVHSFHGVFSRKPYDLSRLPQNARVMAAYESIISSGHRPVIIDAGANVGAASCWFSIKFPAATVIAIEPDAENVAVLRSNVRNRPNVNVVEAAIGSKSGNVNLKREKYSQGTQTVRSVEGGVKIVTIPEAVRLAGADAVLFIAKIDIEGFEHDLFAENTDWVASAPVVFIEPHDWLFPGRVVTKNLLKVFSSSAHEMLITGGDTLAFVL